MYALLNLHAYSVQVGNALGVQNRGYRYLNVQNIYIPLCQSCRENICKCESSNKLVLGEDTV